MLLTYPVNNQHPPPLIVAPPDLRLIYNTDACLLFFKRLRKVDNWGRRGHRYFISVMMKDVQHIDYGFISFLKAVTDQLYDKHVDIHGVLPDNQDCRRFIEGSGFLDCMHDKAGRPFPKAPKSDMISFAKGCGQMSEADNRKIGGTVQKVMEHLTGIKGPCYPIKHILLEICGNSLEWAGPEGEQWLLGVKYEEEKVIFTLTDIGKGILESLHRKFSKQLGDLFGLKPRHEILDGAFMQRYGSSSRDPNRNKGLPMVKRAFEAGVLKRLAVITNNVVLHFGDERRSRTILNRHVALKGTFYQWEMDINSIHQLNQLLYEYD